MLFSATVAGFFLVLCGLWSIWLALGRTPLAIRAPVFLLGTVPLAVIPCMIEGRQNECITYFGLLALAVLCAAVMERTYLILGGMLFAIATLFANAVLIRRGMLSEWFTTTTIALCLLAAAVSSIRLFGFCLIRFTTDAISQDIERASGRDVDEWIAILDAEGADSWNYAEIIIFLRGFGFDYRPQKLIAVAYEKSLGRRMVGQTFDGRSNTIQKALGWRLPQWSGLLGQHRFSVVQLMLWSIAAASFFAFFRLIGRFELTTYDVVIATPVFAAMAWITFFMLNRCLAIRRRIPRVILILLIAPPCVFIPLAIHFARGFVRGGLTPVDVLSVGALLGYALWLSGGLYLVRLRGYRLVRVQSVSQPDKAGYEAFYLGLDWPLVWPMWLANPVFWFGCIYFAIGRWNEAAILGGVAVLLGISEVVLFWESFAVKSGYVLWVLAMLLLTVSGGALGLLRTGLHLGPRNANETQRGGNWMRVGSNVTLLSNVHEIGILSRTLSLSWQPCR